MKQFFDRNYNLLFNRKQCLKLNLRLGWKCEYNSIIDNDYCKFRYLGKNWWRVLKK